MHHLIPLKHTLLSLLLCLLMLGARAQSTFRCQVRDSSTHEALPGVTIALLHANTGAITDAKGEGILQNIPNGPQTILISFVGYKKQNLTVDFSLPGSDRVHTILLAPDLSKLEEVLVTSTRTNSRIEDLPMKVEVLGQEEMEEEGTLVPGNVSSILGDLSIITIQRTNAVNGNDVIRMQGLEGRYTQILRDGLPLYGGFSGSLGVLSIPPLDLKQVEIIKGSASTLYGGGAIGGLINFISKTPQDTAKTTLVLNASTLREGNLNSFLSRKWRKVGMTLFGGANVKTAQDINGDGFAEVPYDASYTLHPRVFFYLNRRSDLNVGFTGTYNSRQGGFLPAIREGWKKQPGFLQTEQVYRNTLDLQFHHQLNARNQLTVKSAGNYFNRRLRTPGFAFSGTQYNSFSEINNLLQLRKQSLITGVNVTTEAFRKQDPRMGLFSNYTNVVPGVFLQHDWQVADKLSVETGFRLDHHNRFGNFFLPRLSFFFKPLVNLSTRLALGTGYKAPSLFDFADPSNALVDFAADIRSERSKGINADINYAVNIGQEASLSINQAFYYTHIDHVNILVTNSAGQHTLLNGNYQVHSYGTDTYLRLEMDGLECYLGYNHTEAFQKYTRQRFNMPFNPKDKISTVLAYELEGKGRVGVEASYSGNQYIYDNQKVRNYWFTAAVIERRLGRASLVLNCENVFDVRQSKFEKIVEGTPDQPLFKPLWAPVEGRVINLSLKWTL